MSLPTKRSITDNNAAPAATATSSSTAASAARSPAMKKAKNGLQHHPQQDCNLNPSHDAVFDPKPMAIDDDLKTDDPTSLPNARSAMAANLSRKKATPPHPPRSKKLAIKLHKAKPTLPLDFEEVTWAKLKSAICAIFLKQPDSCDLENLYQAVNDLCLHKMGGNLYRRIENECEAHISTALQSLVGQSPDLGVFLSLVERCWQDLCDQMIMIRGIALYLDRTYVKQTANVRSLWDMGLQLFCKHLSLSPEVLHKTVTGLLRMIEHERQVLFAGIEILGERPFDAGEA